MEELNLQNKRVILRVDLNVSIVNWKIIDDSRIIAVLDTINFLLKQNCKIILISHFGRPNGQIVPSMSLKQVVPALSNLIGIPVKFVDDVVGDSVKKAVNSLKNSEILLLENIRFYKKEEENCEEFAKEIASYADFYINDTFSCSHRNHASIVSIPKFLPNAAGFLLANEIRNLEKFFNNPTKPMAAITAGAKVSTKLSLLNNLVEQVNILVIGGAMANSFLYALGHDIGKSLYEKNLAEQSRLILEKAKKFNCKIILPKDVIVAKKLEDSAENFVKNLDLIASDDVILDIGPATINEIFENLKNCKTILWNGPLGAFEHPPFDNGTISLARHIATFAHDPEISTIAGGGDIVAALTKAGLKSSFTHISTSGGAFLKWLEKHTLPGIEALEK